MATSCVKKPEIHDQVLETIGKIHNAHESGLGLPLLSLIELFGVELSADERSKIESRGNIVFTKDSVNEGEFVNQGPAITIKRSIGKLTVPARISGDYFSTTEVGSLSFDGTETLTISIIFSKSKLESVLMDQSVVKVDLEGTTFDQCFLHKF